MKKGKLKFIALESTHLIFSHVSYTRA